MSVFEQAYLIAMEAFDTRYRSYPRDVAHDVSVDLGLEAERLYDPSKGKVSTFVGSRLARRIVDRNRKRREYHRASGRVASVVSLTGLTVDECRSASDVIAGSPNREDYAEPHVLVDLVDLREHLAEATAFNRRQKRALQAVMVFGTTMNEAGAVGPLSESRVCQIMRRLRDIAADVLERPDLIGAPGGNRLVGRQGAYRGGERSPRARKAASRR